MRGAWRCAFYAPRTTHYAHVIPGILPPRLETRHEICLKYRNADPRAGVLAVHPLEDGSLLDDRHARRLALAVHDDLVHVDAGWGFGSSTPNLAVPVR